MLTVPREGIGLLRRVFQGVGPAQRIAQWRQKSRAGYDLLRDGSFAVDEEIIETSRARISLSEEVTALKRHCQQQDEVRVPAQNNQPGQKEHEEVQAA